MAGEVFYEPVGEDRYLATGHTAGPWSDQAQHLGPVAALLVRELESCSPGAGVALRRVSVDVMGPVPVGEVGLRAELLRPGRSVELVSAELTSGGRVAATARAWRSARSDTGQVAGVASDPVVPLDLPEMVIPGGWSGGYAAAVEWRVADPATLGTGRVQVWARLRMPLVAGEEPSSLQRLLAIADSASGVSSSISMAEWSFANTDLTVHVHREAAGEWIGMDAESAVGADGAGVASSVLRDVRGPVGRGAQSLFISPR
ncbi:thioesterase family protein [Saccharopolyspora erythraea]|uniref:thioesterase family protein n=1 Tax=Saccharopolyspora erythraea TaxID=1836 RepID=UPI001BA53D25|nr:thioesterase family protein [Saccharopolyspora erythraea]QUH01749.1 thioesterase family protein [Saccharopolyspora erythraea]